MFNYRKENPFINLIFLIAVIFALSFLSGCSDNSNTPQVPKETIAIAAPMVEYAKVAELTRARVYELAEYLR